MTDQPVEPVVIGAMFASASLCDVLGVNEETLASLVASDQVLQLTTRAGVHVFPVAQFGDDGALAPGLSDVIAELATGVDDDPWTWAVWLTNGNPARGGKSPFRMLHDGDLDRVVREACRAAWVWRA
jgi:hypothetical protein